MTTDLYKGVKHTESGHYVFTPPPNGKQKFFEDPTTIKLYPYGACKLRITVFPEIMLKSHDLKKDSCRTEQYNAF